MILVICATRAELRDFARSGVEVVAVGVGPVEAALGTARALCSKHYTLVVNAGIGGGFAGRVAVGESVVVTQEHYVELGREDGSALMLPGGLKLESVCPGDARSLERYRTAEPAVHFGTGITSATITTSAARADVLDARYSAATESMEGFAVLRAATIAGVPALELRGISNIVGVRAASQWDFAAGAAAAVRTLTGFLDVVQGSR